MPKSFTLEPTLLLLVRMFLVTLMVTASPVRRMQLCGSDLANKLAEICSDNGYNDPFSNVMYYETGALPRTRLERGVADECCKTGCTWETLEQYCNAPLSPPDRSKILPDTDDHSINHIQEDDPVGSSLSAVASSEEGQPDMLRDQKNDLVSKVRGHHDKKGRRANNRCRCRRRRRRGKGDIEEIERHLNKIAPVIGTINPSLINGIPVILSPRLRREGKSLQGVNRK